MSNNELPWKTWKTKWVPLSSGDGGGQGDVKYVERKNSLDKEVCFLKILRDQNDIQRRKRMYREVAAYKTLEHSGIPKFIDTNAEKFEDTSYKLYLVTQFVDGLTLEKFIKEKGEMEIDVAIQFTIHLLNIVGYCHDNQILHRDIKPDNIIVKENNQLEPVLIDFGLSFNQRDEEDNNTYLSEELGNRFLRLPELSASSLNKRDIGSDITFCAGIFLYLLTSEYPNILLNEKKQMPHQRNEIRSKLEKNISKDCLPKLLGLFDRSFQWELTNRWHKLSEFSLALQEVSKSTVQDESLEGMWKQINSHVNQPHLQIKISELKKLKYVISKVIVTGRALEASFKHQFIFIRGSSPDNSAKTGVLESMLTFKKLGQNIDSNWIRFKAELIGSEIVLTATYKEIAHPLNRTSIEAFNYNADLEDRIKKVFLQKIRDVISE